MKFRLWEIITFVSLIVLAIIFGLLNSFWGGFVYFTFSSLCALVGIFINNRIYYIKYVKKEYDDGIEMYFAELYNNNLITKEQYDNYDERIINGYYRDFRKLKATNILIMVSICLVLIPITLAIFTIW